MRHSRVLAIDCGSAHVACTLFAVGTGKRLRLLQWATEPLALDPAAESQWPAAVTRALATIQRRERFPVRECVLGVPGHLALTKFVKTPAVDREKRARIVQFEAAQNIPHPLAEVAWDYVEVNDDGVDLELMLAAVKLDAMEGLCAAVEAAGFVVTRAEPGSLALWRACGCGDRAPVEPALLVDVGARSTHLVFTGPTGFFTRTLPLGGNVVTHVLAEELHLDFRAAEALKLQVLTGGGGGPADAITQSAVARACDSFFGRLQLEITRSRLGYSRQAGAAAPERVLLTGAGSRLPELAEKLAAKLELPVARYDAVRPIDLTERSKLDGAATATDHLAVPTGLALPPRASGRSVLDLLPASRHASQTWRRLQPWWLAAAAMAVAALLPPLAYYQVRTERLQKSLAAYERELGPLHRLEDSNHTNLERLKKLQQQIAAIRRLAEGRASWIAFLGDLQTRLGKVGDVWLEKLQVVEDPVVKSESPQANPPRRLALAGRLLDTKNPLAKASDEAHVQVKRLIESLSEGPFVQAVESERFDNSQPGILRFDVTLVMKTENPL